MPTGNRREDTFVDIFLSAYEGGSWRDASVERPEKTQDNAVEAIAKRQSDDTTLAIEHTIVEPFVGEKGDLAQFSPTFEKLQNDKCFLVADRITRIFVPVGVLDRQKSPTRKVIADGIGAWLKSNVASLPKGWSNPECKIDIPSSSPLVIILTAQVVPTPKFASFLIARQQISADLNKVVEKALRKKLPKLVRAQVDRRILMLERQHMNLLPKQIIDEIEKARPILPELAKIDEIWFAETIFYERDGAICFFRYDANGNALAEISYWDGRVRISWDQADEGR
jgi:hypothetical protein